VSGPKLYRPCCSCGHRTYLPCRHIENG
jgi:hypothetical protein